MTAQTNMSAEEKAEIDRIRGLPWIAQFHKTLDNPTVPGGKVDMYMLMDDDTGESIVGLSVPHGQRWIAEYVAGCCADPYFVRAGKHGETAMARAFNSAIQPFFAKNGTVDGREVMVAAMVMVEAYVGAMPKRSRQDLIDNAIKMLRVVRDKG